MAAASDVATRDVPTMPGGHPLLGHALEFGRDPLALFQRAREHGDVVRIRFGPFRVYVLNSPDAIRQALVGEARKLTSANVPGLAWVPTRSNRRFSAANRRLRSLLTDVIDGYRSRGVGTGAGAGVGVEEEEGEQDHGDLISILMRARDDDTGAGMTNEQLRDEATTLVIAGSETTGNTLAWACYLLAQHPQLQARLEAEADRVLAGADADYETVSRLPFTRAVITETLRLYSPVWILPRRALVDVELDGYLLPAGGRMFFSPYALNRDARLHRDPDRFDPDRWGADYSRSDLRATFFPFGQGIRNCIGEGFAWTESILLLSEIAARWHLRLVDGADVHPVVSSTLVPSELPIIVTRRAG
jgi:cytochrome P450